MCVCVCVCVCVTPACVSVGPSAAICRTHNKWAELTVCQLSCPVTTHATTIRGGGIQFNLPEKEGIEEGFKCTNSNIIKLFSYGRWLSRYTLVKRNTLSLSPREPSLRGPSCDVVTTEARLCVHVCVCVSVCVCLWRVKRHPSSHQRRQREEAAVAV